MPGTTAYRDRVGSVAHSGGRRGDLAAVVVVSTRNTAGRIYVGGVSSVSSIPAASAIPKGS